MKNVIITFIIREIFRRKSILKVDMKRRSFLKSVLGFLALPFMPKSKGHITENTIGEKGRIVGQWIYTDDISDPSKPIWRRREKLKPSDMIDPKEYFET